jgi:hypothetical protein
LHLPESEAEERGVDEEKGVAGVRVNDGCQADDRRRQQRVEPEMGELLAPLDDERRLVDRPHRAGETSSGGLR